LTQEITVNMKGLIKTVALVIELAPSATWGEPLHLSGLFSVLVNQLAADKVNYMSLFIQGRDIVTERTLQLSAVILVEYILLLSRIALADVQVFVTLVALTAKSKGVPEGEIWEVIMSQWWNRVSLGLTITRRTFQRTDGRLPICF
jgi:hypothetical protein